MSNSPHPKGRNGSGVDDWVNNTSINHIMPPFLSLGMTMEMPIYLFKYTHRDKLF